MFSFKALRSDPKLVLTSYFINWKCQCKNSVSSTSSGSTLAQLPQPPSL